MQKVENIISAMKGESKEISWTRGALDCLASWDEFIKTNDILECMFADNLAALQNPLKRRNYSTALSVALNKLCASGKVINLTIDGVKGFFYGLPQWWNEDVRAGYMEKLNERVGEQTAKSFQ